MEVTLINLTMKRRIDIIENKEIRNIEEDMLDFSPTYPPIYIPLRFLFNLNTIEGYQISNICMCGD